MIKKIRFIAGALLSLFISWLYVDHVIGIARHIDKGFIRILDWFLVCILFHVVFFLLSNLMCVRIGFPKHDGNVGKTVLSWVVFVFGMPVIFVVKLVMFFIQGGFSDIFPPSNEEDDGYEPQRSAPATNNANVQGGTKNGYLDLRRGLDRICSRYHGKRIYDANTPHDVEVYCEKVECKIEMPYSGNANGVIYFYIEYRIVGYDGRRDLRNFADTHLNHYSYDDLFSDVDDLIEKLMQTCGGLRCKWKYISNQSANWEYSN